jgi:uncharacterized protein (DUF58 family)
MSLPDRELCERFRRLAVMARRAGAAVLLDGPRRRLPGGTEVASLRGYSPGDDCRHIDWYWCARRDELLSKVFAGDQDLTLYILLDCSASMGMGQRHSPQGGTAEESGLRAKFDVARRIAAVLGYAVLANMDRLGVAAFAGGMLDQLPPLRHHSRLPRLLRFLGELDPCGEATDLAAAARTLVHRYQRHGPVVVISDLYDPNGFREGLDVLRLSGYEPRLVHLYDPAEAQAGLLGDVELCDVEGGAVRTATITQRTAARYRQLVEEFRAEVRTYCRKHVMPCVQLDCHLPDEKIFRELLRPRATRHPSLATQR